MAVPTANELDAVAAISKRLQTALQHARFIKPGTAIDPPLPLSSVEKEVDQLQDEIADSYDQSYRFAAVETAARDIFYSLITSLAIDEPEFVEVWNLLDILLVAGDSGKCAPELVVWLVEELLDSQTTEGCRKVFDFLESRRERLAQKDFHKKNLVFLRSCNELLRRLSRAEDASFCGRVFFFLFQTFPLGDKSSVNLRGEFHVENTTAFDESVVPVPAPAVAETNGTVDAASTTDLPGGASTPSRPAAQRSRPDSRASKTAKKQPGEVVVDNSTLYPMFWRLQQTFSVPTKLFNPAEFQSFKAALSATLTKFKKTPPVVQTNGAQRRSEELKEKDNDNGPDFSENYNPKYLTSRDLFDLELNDQAFQRHILVQTLILLDFLLSLTEGAKKKLQEVEHPNKSMLYDFTLSAEDSEWALDVRQLIGTFFVSTPEGKFYDRMVQTILARDKNWVRWKVESCPSIVRDALSIDETFDVRSKTQRQTKPRRIDARTMGAMELDFLEDEQSRGVESLRDPERYNMLKADQLLDGIKTDNLDLEMAMDEEEKISLNSMIQNKTWRLLRNARADQFEILSRYESGKDLEEVFRPHPSLAIAVEE